MDQIIGFIQGLDFKNFDFLALLNTLLGLIKSVISGQKGGEE